LAQQFTSLLLYTFASKNKTFIKHAGNINFEDFWKNKFLFLSFSFFFMANILFNFYGNQMVPNVNMFLSLRKLNAIALFLMDIYIGKKRFSCVTVSSIILIVGGAFVIGYDKLDSNLLGYLVVLGNNLMSLLYTKYSEVFRKITGFSNLKLLVYNAYICNPILLAGIFITGEYKRLLAYFSNNAEGIDPKYYGYYGTFFFLFLSAFFCFILTSSFFISNEKISSLMTNLLNNSRTIFISASLYFFDSSKNELNLRMIIGLGMSTIGAIFINAENLINNLIFNTGSKKDKKEEKDEEKGVELKDVPEQEDNKKKEEENKNN
jgi:drug/metabolite transporter (DMT)-like permease